MSGQAGSGQAASAGAATQLELQHVRVSLGGKPVLRDLSLVLRGGMVTALVGPNGAGKSTLLRVLTRVLRPDGGEVCLAGRSLQHWSRRELARRMAIVAQEPKLPEGFTVFDLVMMGRSPYLGALGRETAIDLEAVRGALRRVRLESLADRRVEELSGGERQRVALARALAQTPAWLLLDEPTNNLDVRHQIDILRFVRAQASSGLGVLIVLHDLNLAARAADRVVLLEAGAVRADGLVGEVLTEGLLRSVYRADVLVHDARDGRPVMLPSLAEVEAAPPRDPQ